MLESAVKNYLCSNRTTPYFLIVGDDTYQSVKDSLSGCGFAFVRTSDYCGGDDKLPDLDSLMECLKAEGTGLGHKKLAVLGLGEYLSMRGEEEAISVLFQLKDLNIKDKKVVLLLRGVAAQIKSMQFDIRFDSRRFDIMGEAKCGISLTYAAPSVPLQALQGVKALLIKLEDGACGDLSVQTIIPLDKALFTVHKIADAYEGIRFTVPGFDLPRSCGEDAQWSELLEEWFRNDKSLDKVFKKYDFRFELDSGFYLRLAGEDYENWLYFIALKCRTDSLSNSYLRFVLKNTQRFHDLKRNLLNAIIEIFHTDSRFAVFYAERKKLIDRFPESDVADFVVNNRRETGESIFKLTDSSITEQQEIIAWVSDNGIIPQITDIYPDLAAYLKGYVFHCGELSELLTEYFEDYKRQKVSNKLEPAFLQQVDKLAKSRKYNRLPSRDEVLDGLKKEDSWLCWVDALGVEYLSYISELARMRNLSVSIHISRAELPTITSVNRGFFDDWDNDKREKIDRLDNIKHNESADRNFENSSKPIYLAQELDVLKDVMDQAATGLTLHHYKNFLIASDHGASRLAVLREKEEKYETDTKGDHSGRCCKLFEPYDLPFAAEENGYLVLADYGRFQGSRKANIEVHGGASLEEVVVPIIELTLRDNSIRVELIEKSVTADYRTGAEITLFFNSLVKNVSVLLKDKRYPALKVDDNHYKVPLPDTKRAGDYAAEVYVGDDLIDNINIHVHGRSGMINDAFDDLF